jgi:hypothetical protein
METLKNWKLRMIQEVWCQKLFISLTTMEKFGAYHLTEFSFTPRETITRSSVGTQQQENVSAHASLAMKSEKPERTELVP